MNVVLNLGNWSYRNLSDFAKAVSQGDQETMFSLGRKIIVEWEYDVDLNLPDAINELGMEEGVAVLQAINDTITNFVENADISKYVVSFKVWKNKDFFAFNDARKVGNIATIEKMLRQVVDIPNDNKEQPLSATNGSLALRAVNKAYEKLINGKN